MNDLSINETKALSEQKLTRTERFAKNAILAMLKKIRFGHLTVEDGDEIFHFGEPVASAKLRAHIVVHHASVYRDVLMNATVGSGEAYMQGSWSSPDLIKVIQLMVNNLAFLSRLDSGAAVHKRLASKVFQWLTANTLQGSKKNIAAHYDLGNDFFQLFLDETMMYSSAIFPETQVDLYQASMTKLDQICRKLELNENDHVIEIGTGWGGFALHAAEFYGCRVTTTTISGEQYAKAVARVKAAGLENKITVLKEDYRNLEGQFDKLVSIEMIEAVGHEFYASYFKTCNALLKPNGRMLIQAITIPDQRYHEARKRVDFIKRYIFPGGCLPSNAIFTKYLAEYTDMQLIGFDDITAHYATTLACWRERFWQKIDQVKAQGFDDTFIRMWDFYLAYCEGGFRERVIGTAHFLCAKPDYRF